MKRVRLTLCFYIEFPENKEKLIMELTDAVKKHKKTYNDEDDNNDSRSLGTAAAMQALKMFNQGEAGSGKSSNSQSMFLGLAMSEASKVSILQLSFAHIAFHDTNLSFSCSTPRLRRARSIRTRARSLPSSRLLRWP